MKLLQLPRAFQVDNLPAFHNFIASQNFILYHEHAA
jgi:hypothetical protein